MIALNPVIVNSAEILQIKSSNTILVGDQNRSLTIGLFCVDVNEKDDVPFKIDTDWLPNEDFYDVLTLTNIPKEFADSTLSEFILYWKETGQSHNSWNSKFLQHVKFQWQKQKQKLVV